MFNRNEPTTISDDKPLEVGKLKVYPNKLEYDGVKCNFVDILHIGWYWLSQNTSIINTQDVRLNIFIRGREKPIYISKSTLYVTPKLVKAYQFIAKNTFQNRLRFYTAQLEKTGGFIYDRCNIYTDGRVVSNGKSFNLSEAKLEPFEISIKKGGWFGSKVKIDLNLDRDILLTLIDFILKNPQEPSAYVNNHNYTQESADNSRYFIRDIVSLMAKLSGADGHVSPEEVAVVKEFLLDTMKLDKRAFSEAVSIFNYAKSSPGSFEYFAESLFSRLKYDEETILAILDLLFAIAIADGTLSAEEELLLLEVENIFGLKGPNFRKFKTEKNHSKNNTKQFYLNILGLSSDASKDEIRAEYKRLVMKFHPDRVYHLGDDFVKEAEAKIKEINQAYEYLNNKA